MSTLATRIALALSSALESTAGRWKLLGPAPCALYRLKGDYRWHVLVKAPAQADIGAVVGPVIAKLGRHDGVKLSVDIDPGNLL